MKKREKTAGPADQGAEKIFNEAMKNHLAEIQDLPEGWGTEDELAFQDFCLRCAA